MWGLMGSRIFEPLGCNSLLGGGCNASLGGSVITDEKQFQQLQSDRERQRESILTLSKNKKTENDVTSGGSSVPPGGGSSSYGVFEVTSVAASHPVIKDGTCKRRKIDNCDSTPCEWSIGSCDVDFEKALRESLDRSDYIPQEEHWLAAVNCPLEAHKFEQTLFSSTISEVIRVRHSCLPRVLPACHVGDFIALLDRYPDSVVPPSRSIDIAMVMACCLPHNRHLSYKTYMEIGSNLYLTTASNNSKFVPPPLVWILKQHGASGHIFWSPGGSNRSANIEQNLKNLKGEGCILSCKILDFESIRNEPSTIFQKILIDAGKCFNQAGVGETKGVVDICYIEITSHSSHYIECCMTEISGRRQLCGSICIALRSLAKGGDMIIRIRSAYTRFTACVLLMLSTTFDSIKIWRPPSCPPWTGDRFIVCVNAKEYHPCRRLLQMCWDVMAIDGRYLPQFLPLKFYLIPSFLNFLTSSNDFLAKQEVDNFKKMKKLTKQLLERSSDCWPPTQPPRDWRASTSHESEQTLKNRAAFDSSNQSDTDVLQELLSWMKSHEHEGNNLWAEHFVKMWLHDISVSKSDLSSFVDILNPPERHDEEEDQHDPMDEDIMDPMADEFLQDHQLLTNGDSFNTQDDDPVMSDDDGCGQKDCENDDDEEEPNFDIPW
eukprot:GHVL01044410.1.p1 GENE.GHVL01044410.1~~GHVL01044410.1.p1  ORF type:complete len:660 (+),score=157.40 GHVL01044410.1:1178-3157(+)